MVSLSHWTAEPEIFFGPNACTVKDRLSCQVPPHSCDRLELFACGRFARVTNGHSLVIIYVRGKDRFSRMARGFAVIVPGGRGRRDPPAVE